MIFQNTKRLALGIVFISSVVNFSCSSNKAPVKIELDLDKNIIDSLVNKHGNNIAFLSCLRCDCFRNELNKTFDKTGMLPQGYVLMTDTVCTKLKFPAVFIHYLTEFPMTSSI